MKRRHHHLAENETEQGLDMSSLIDISFLLLIYFIVTSTLDPKEGDIGLTMPRVPDGSSVGIDYMDIEIDANNQISVNDEKVELTGSGRGVPKLLDRLVTYVESAEVMRVPPIVTISAADDSNSQRFIDVLNALSDKNVAIQNVLIKQ